MHMVDGEHGHSHGSCGCGGEHPHTHEGEHVHDHAHEHGCQGHTHQHSHGEGGCQGCQGGCERPANEQEAILAYMLDHNRHHAAELLEIAKQFKAGGKEDAAVQIEKAVEDFEKGNMRLSIALSLVRSPQ